MPGSNTATPNFLSAAPKTHLRTCPAALSACAALPALPSRTLQPTCRRRLKVRRLNVPAGQRCAAQHAWCLPNHAVAPAGWQAGTPVCRCCSQGSAQAQPPQCCLGHAGSAILRFASKLGTTCDTLNSAFPVPALNACKSWRDGSNGGAPDLKLALAVADDCSVTIQPVGDKTCADPGAVAGTTALFPRLAGLSAADEYLYTYNDLTIRAYYIAAYKIRTLLPSSDGGARWACIAPSHLYFGCRSRRSWTALRVVRFQPMQFAPCAQLLHAAHQPQNRHHSGPPVPGGNQQAWRRRHCLWGECLGCGSSVGCWKVLWGWTVVSCNDGVIELRPLPARWLADQGVHT